MSFPAQRQGRKKDYRKRATRMTFDQANHLANFMLKHKEFATRQTGNEDVTFEEQRREVWKRLASELNSMSGANKKVESWKKAWLDLKRTSRLRVTRIMKKNGCTDMDKVNILDLDRKVLQSVDVTIKVQDDAVVHGEDDLTFVGVKSDESIHFLEDEQSVNNQDEATHSDIDVKEDLLTQLNNSQESSSYVPLSKFKRSALSDSDVSDRSNYSEESLSDDNKFLAKRKGKKNKGKRKKSEDNQEGHLEKVLRELQDDYASGLKAIADAIIKVGTKQAGSYQPKPKRLAQPWFHYLRFDK